MEQHSRQKEQYLSKPLGLDLQRPWSPHTPTHLLLLLVAWLPLGEMSQS